MHHRFPIPLVDCQSVGRVCQPPQLGGALDIYGLEALIGPVSAQYRALGAAGRHWQGSVRRTSGVRGRREHRPRKLLHFAGVPRGLG